MINMIKCLLVIIVSRLFVKGATDDQIKDCYVFYGKIDSFHDWILKPVVKEAMERGLV